jgi:hypothetical protein
MSSARIQGTNLTGGSVTPGYEFKLYVYGGDKPLHAEKAERLLAGAAAHIARRRGREDQFAAILTELGVTDLGNAPLAAIIEAGKRVGVGEKTAKSYLAALKRRQENTS